MYIKILFASIVLAVGNCQNKEDINAELMTVNYKPTQCAEVYDNLFDNGELSREQRFLKYLKEKGITEIIDFKNKPDNGVYCLACTCPSGDNFSFKVSANDYKKLKTIPPFDVVLK